jgi:membrane fusion protein (multidrug efflux system)
MKVATLALALAMLAGCGGGADTSAETANATPETRLTPVQTIKLSAVDFNTTAKLTGEAEAEETVTVSAEVPGLVFRVDYDEGKEIAKGQRLAQVDSRVDQTRAGQLNANLAQSERDLNRALELQAKGLATEADIERARLAVKNNRYNLRMTRIGVGKSVVNSPVAGVVDKVHTEAGEYANPGQPLVTIVNYDTIVVRAGLPETRVRYARVGETVKIMIPALGLDREGTILRIGIQANTKNRTFPLEISVANTDRQIRPGMRAQVVLPTETFKDALLVPRDTVLDTRDGRFVYIVVNGKATRKAVKLGPDTGELVVVTEGLSSGQEIVNVGHHGLPKTADVEVTASKPCCSEALKAMEGGK